MLKSVYLAAALLFLPMISTAEANWMANPVKRIAEITLNLNHYPSDSEKDELKQMMNNEGVNEQLRLIAHALYNIKHSVNATDKKQLAGIAADTNTPSQIRDLARIIGTLNHKPSASDKQTLQKLIDA